MLETMPDSRPVDISRWTKVINFCLYAVVLLVPVFFLSLTSEVHEFNKQALIFLGTIIILGVWIVKIISTRKVSWVKTPFDFVLLGYLVIYLISSLTSIDRVSSFLGYYGRFVGSFASVVIFIVLYYLIVNNVRRVQTLRKISGYLAGGMALVLIYSFLQILGLYILPFSFTHSQQFNPIGSMAALAIYSALALVYIQWLLFAAVRKNFWKTLVLWLISLVALAIMFLVNAFSAWLVLALGLMAFLTLSQGSTTESTSEMNRNWYWKPMIILIISILFVAFHFLPDSVNPRNLVRVNLPVEIQLSNSTTWNLTLNSLKNGTKSAVLGSGPGTTGIVYGDIKPESLNKSIVWGLNFDRASSEISGITIETGILGLLSFELVAVLFLIYGLFFLLKKGSHPGWKYGVGLFSLWLVLYLAHFFYFFNTTFYFLYWLAIALFVAATHLSQDGSESQDLSLSSSPRSALSWMFVSLIVLAALLISAFFAASVYGAEVAYTQGAKLLAQANPDFNQVSDDFSQAITLNPYRDTYLLAYAQNLIFLSSVEAAKEKPDISKIQTWITGAISAGIKTTQMSPAKASNWSALAQFYSGISPLVSGMGPKIIDAWQQAINRDPKNPALYVQLAQAYSAASEIIDPSIVGSGPDSDQDGLPDSTEAILGSDPHNSDTNGNGVSDGDEVKAGFNPAGTGRLSPAMLAKFTRIDSAMLNKAEEALNTAIKIKPDLPDSYIELARVLEKGNKLDQAKAELDNAAKAFPNNPDVLFEQGRITFNQKDYASAEKIFKNVLALSPNHANAHFSLGQIYLQQGDKASALTEFQITRQITGPNVDLDKLINSLQPAATPAPTK